MWLGGIVNGFIPTFGSGFLMDAVRGLASAYVVGWIGARFTRNAGLMAAGAFAGTALGLISSVTSGAGGLLSSFTGGVQTPKQSGSLGTGTVATNVVQMPVTQTGTQG